MTLEKTYKINFFVEENGPQTSRVEVVKNAPIFRKRNPSSLFVQIRPTKRCAEVFFKINLSPDI